MLVGRDRDSFTDNSLIANPTWEDKHVQRNPNFHAIQQQQQKNKTKSEWVMHNWKGHLDCTILFFSAQTIDFELFDHGGGSIIYSIVDL